MSFSAQKSFRLMPLFFQTSINENINCESVLSGCSIGFFQQNYFANFSNERCSSPDGYIRRPLCSILSTPVVCVSASWYAFTSLSNNGSTETALSWASL